MSDELILDLSDTASAQLRARLESAGQLSLADYMASANAVYYGTRDPLGAEGDFITAPEISQMFGELIGMWCADLWMRMGKPEAAYIELGPGRGTLARDALRAMAMAGFHPQVHLVETSLALRLRQAETLPNPQFHADLSDLPKDRPLFVIANEFFDALPIQQVIKQDGGWHQRDVIVSAQSITPLAGAGIPDAVIPENLRDAPEGSIIETSPSSVRIMGHLAKQIAAQGGAGLIIDYGYEGPAVGETFQAVRGHAFADPFTDPGEQDLTAHVDFATLAAMAEMAGAVVQGPIGQGQFLARLGLVERAMALSERHPARAEQFSNERDRLTGADQMGRLFRVLAIRHPEWPEADGF